MLNIVKLKELKIVLAVNTKTEKEVVLFKDKLNVKTFEELMGGEIESFNYYEVGTHAEAMEALYGYSWSYDPFAGEDQASKKNFAVYKYSPIKTFEVEEDFDNTEELINIVKIISK